MIGKVASLFLLILITAVSCKKECDMEVMKVMEKNAKHVVSYECIGDKIRFTIEAFSDVSYGHGGEWPDIDIYRLFIDYNRNGIVDEGIDLMLSPHKLNAVCIAKLITATSTTPCSFEPEVIYSYSFGLGNTSKHHVSFIVVVPKSLLSNSSTAHVVLHVYDSEKGWDYYPSNGPLFTDYFKIKW